MSSTKLRRLSQQEGDGSKLRRFNVLYPKTIIQQHVLDIKREKERKKQKRLELQEQQQILFGLLGRTPFCRPAKRASRQPVNLNRRKEDQQVQ
ncbi:unnamed protein product (macronuclear) [Paramecium tetraurelia]|uniref:Uncharacterized protein n=1 Tax=Paramecium tetraurelia TaxID=5888 RepID=A0DK14_PARTE|nr:uncharacterized protein GSPATT00017725001 [Paramecium tetraurelia]CAK83381.1 unnamed protein product [Paramecium tetraurelia]|eukprot:XP_001450778.1 hypothetical protein (macronuclear) [Paramecium tetraurelia strain d4-2]